VLGLKITPVIYTTMSIELTKTSTKNLNISIDGTPIKIKVSMSAMPFGFSVTDYGGYGPSKNLNISIEDDDVIDTIRTIETNVLMELSNISQDIFHRQVDMDELITMFNSNLTEDGRLRIKHTKDTVIFDESGKVMHPAIFDGDFAKWSTTCNFIVSGLYFMNKKIGLILKANHVRLFEPKKESSGYMFLDSESDSD